MKISSLFLIVTLVYLVLNPKDTVPYLLGASFLFFFSQDDK